MKRHLALVLLATVALAPIAAFSRVGGGHSYSGSSSSSSRSSSSSGSSRSSSSSSSSWGSSRSSGSSGVTWSSGRTGETTPLSGLCSLVMALAVIGFCLYIAQQRQQAGAVVYSSPLPPSQPMRRSSPAEALQLVDRTFSEPVFLEWATLLFVRGQKSRGGTETVLSPWFDDVDQALPKAIDGRPVGEVLGVVVGTARINSFNRTAETAALEVSFRACLTCRNPRGDQSWYLEETWHFRRAAGARSRKPDDVEKIACPSCGSPFERDPMGRCPSCSQELVPGQSDWAVAVVSRAPPQSRPPLLLGDVEEQGTSSPSVRSPTLGRDRTKLEASSPGFRWPEFEARARAIFLALQEGWSAQKWEALRPLESENVFQSHRFWIDEYKKQGLRNQLDDVKLHKVEVVKVGVDACYEWVTCRMHAAMRDSTVRVADGTLMAGNPQRPRPFTEYWTFLRRPGATPKEGASLVQCPSCGAPQKISQAGVCEYCQAKVTSGAFGWVLSRIEQDEEYQG